MAVSYKKLWKLLIDKDIKKKDLSAKAGVSPATITKMGKNGHVTTEVLVKICSALGCGVDDIMEMMSYNILSTPAVVVDGEVKIKGRVPSESEIKELLGL